MRARSINTSCVTSCAKCASPSTSRIAVEYVRSRYRVTISRKAASESICAYSASNLWLSVIFIYAVKTRQQGKPHIRISFFSIQPARTVNMLYDSASGGVISDDGIVFTRSPIGFAGVEEEPRLHRRRRANARARHRG